MNVIYISPNFPPNFYHFCIELKRAGANVLAIGDAPYDTFIPELKQVITEYCCIDMLDYDKVFRTVAYLSSKYGKIDRIDSQTEFWLALEAELRLDFNIYGQKPSDLEINQSKLGMKYAYKKASVPVVDAIPIDNPDILGDFIETHGFPFIIKPDRGVGASNTYRVTSEKKLSKILRDLPPGYIIEPFVEGKIITFDGLVDRSGEIMFCASFELNGNVLEILQKKAGMHYLYSKNISPKLEKLGRRVIKGFDIRERFFHCEFFRTPAGEYLGLEINVRPPGGFSLDMLNYTSDINLYKIWAELLVKDQDNLEYTRKYHVANVSRRDYIDYIHDKKAIMHELGNIVVEATRIPDVYAEVMGNDAYILRHPDMNTLLSAIAFVEETRK
jgi:hypothetical protein